MFALPDLSRHEIGIQLTEDPTIDSHRNWTVRLVREEENAELEPIRSKEPVILHAGQEIVLPHTIRHA